MSRIRWGRWGDPLDMEDEAGFFVLLVVFWLLAFLGHWIWFPHEDLW